MTRLADLAFDERNGIVVARLSGELDLSNVADMEDALEQAAGTDAVGLVLDLAQVRHIDSAGVRMLFDLRRRLGQRRQELVVAVPQRARIHDVLDLLAVAETVPVFDDLDAAVASIGS